MKQILLLISFLVTLVYGNDSLFLEANRLYDEQLFDSAATLYSESIQQNGESSVVYYNLGNCSYRLGRLGEAILYNEKAIRLNPDDEQISANLNYLQTQIVDELPTVESNPIADTVKYFHTLFSLEQELWIAFIVSLLLLIFVARSLFSNGAKRVWAIYSAGATLVVLLMVGGSAAVKVYKLENERHAIVLEDVAEARSEPNGGQLIFTVHEGTKVKVNSVQGNWMFVSLPNGASGYIKSSLIGEI